MYEYFGHARQVGGSLGEPQQTAPHVTRIVVHIRGRPTNLPWLAQQRLHLDSSCTFDAITTFMHARNIVQRWITLINHATCAMVVKTHCIVVPLDQHAHSIMRYIHHTITVNHDLSQDVFPSEKKLDKQIHDAQHTQLCLDHYLTLESTLTTQAN